MDDVTAPANMAEEANGSVSRKRELGPGLYFDLPEDEYHASAGASVSRLKLVLQAPAKVRVPQADKPVLRFGRLIHFAVLQPHLLAERYFITDLKRFDPRTKDYAAEVARAGGRELVKREDFEAALSLSREVRQHPTAGWLLEEGELSPEVSFYWKDPVTGLLCRGRADGLRPDPNDPGAFYAIDVKGVEDASPEGFARTAANYDYHMQDAHYRNGLARCGLRITNFLFIAVEKDAPHLVGVYEMDERARELGRLQTMAALETWARCQASGVWPGYSEEVEPLALPGWLYANSGV